MGKRKLGRGVAMVGAGICHFGSFPEKSTRDLFVEAFTDMRRSMDKKFDPGRIDDIYIGCFSSELFEGQGHTVKGLANTITRYKAWFEFLDSI